MNDIHESVVLGEGTKVWSFTVIERDVKIGKNCVIGAQCYIGAGTVIGDNVRLQTGVFLPRDAVIEADVFIGPHVVFTDDRYPRVGNTTYLAQPPHVEFGASIGAGAVILPGVRIGAGSMIAAGAVVVKDVTMGDLIVGVPGHSKRHGKVIHAH